MDFDIFLSIAQTPVDQHTPDEDTMFNNFFEQLRAADDLGFGTAWVAQAHLSTEIQKMNKNPVVPHWEGEVGLCTDFFQLAHLMFGETKKINVGSAVMSLLTHGGPVGIAERVGAFLALHGLNKGEKRKLRIGFSAGRFEFMARPYGIVPRDIVEEAAWPALRGQIFGEACEIFLRLLNGEIVNSNVIRKTVLTRSNFRSDEDWTRVQEAFIARDSVNSAPDNITIPNRYIFEDVKNIPQAWNRDLLDLILGSHDPALQEQINEIRPVKVFNLSITPPEVIEATHERMSKHYHTDGGPWKRNYMPRTLMVFLNDESNLSMSERTAHAKKEAEKSLSSYWGALEGTIDPMKVSKAADNSVIGNVEEVANQIAERFHPDDCIMAWFDFFNHDSPRVIRNMDAFMNKVVPRVKELIN
jgi:alkanesulfonate monooxygenase SsuD/methylene tetrahydromethanopterin reductase-like flavin-dependent oxidoreductase (luciferase family)|tara:strand:- start:1759 stop:3000 length:1242 start_codon:yes stop_codon:yes gene_type:complete